MKIEFNKVSKIIMDKSLDIIKLSGIAFLISFLGTYSGSAGTSKNWRRIGIPVVFLIGSLFSIECSIWCLTIVAQHFVLRLGWGIPDATDEGSLIGRTFYKTFKGNNFWTNFCTRGFIAFLLCVGFVGVPIVKGNWITYILCSVGIILTFALIAWRNLGEFTFKIKDKTIYCCKSDVIVFGILGLAGMKILF